MNTDQVRPANASASGFLLRLYWLFGGNGLAAILALSIALQKTYNSILINSIYLLTVVLLIVSRYIDVKYCAGQTAEGEPASIKNWIQYSILAVAIYAVVWIVAQLLGRFVS
jgi:hypothetical protein